jgi:hypothetical protein
MDNERSLHLTRDDRLKGVAPAKLRCPEPGLCSPFIHCLYEASQMGVPDNIEQKRKPFNNLDSQRERKLQQSTVHVVEVQELPTSLSITALSMPRKVLL